MGVIGRGRRKWVTEVSVIGPGSARGNVSHKHYVSSHHVARLQHLVQDDKRDRAPGLIPYAQFVVCTGKFAWRKMQVHEEGGVIVSEGVGIGHDDGDPESEAGRLLLR